MEEPRTKIAYCGTDSWGRAVFKSARGYFYKSANELDPDVGFPNADEETKELILRDLNTAEPPDEFEGEPGWPVDRDKFELA